MLNKLTSTLKSKINEIINERKIHELINEYPDEARAYLDEKY